MLSGNPPEQFLSDQPQLKKLLLVITDDKPNEIDHYEHRYGLEDTKKQYKKRVMQVSVCLP